MRNKEACEYAGRAASLTTTRGQWSTGSIRNVFRSKLNARTLRKDPELIMEGCMDSRGL